MIGEAGPRRKIGVEDGLGGVCMRAWMASKGWVNAAK